METTLRHRHITRLVGFGLLTVALGIGSEVLPKALNLNKHWGGGFLTGEAYGTMLALLLAGIIIGALEPSRPWTGGWSLLIGLAPLVETIIRMSRQGPGNLWPIAIAVALMIGWPPVLAGALIGWCIRKRVGRLPPTDGPDAPAA